MKFGRTLIYSGLCGALIQGQAMAQGPMLDEIVVTAQKRSENLQDVPIAVNAVSNKMIEQGRLQTSSDLQFVVPSLNFGQLSTFSQVYIRGVGTDITSANADNSVATYVDGVFVSGQVGALQSLLGVERVEVLKGPQGTLYGRNAVGGAISIFTPTPTAETEMKLSAGFGNFDRREVKGHVSGAVSDTLALGVYGGYVERDTYLDIHTQLHPGFGSNYRQKEQENEENWAIRLKGVWTPTDALTVTASAEHLTIDSVEGGVFRNILPNAFGYALYDPSVNTPGIIEEYRVETSEIQYSRTDQDNGTLKLELDLDWANFVSISGYRLLRNSGSDDIDGTFAPILLTTSREDGFQGRSFSQEFQLLSNEDSDISWIVGAYGYRERTGFTANDTVSGLPGLLDPVNFSLFDQILKNFGQVEAKSYAVFGQTTFALDSFVEGLSVTLGARFTRDEKEYFDGRTTVLFEPGDVEVTLATYPEQDESWTDFSPKIGVDYQTDTTLFYASASQAYKAGLYNITSPADIIASGGAVDPEELTAFEVGTKSEFMDGRMRLNTSLYWYDFSEIQVQRVDNSAGGALTVQNAAEATLYGAEADLTYALTERLTVTGSVALSDSEYEKFDNAAVTVPFEGPGFGPNTSAVEDVSGNNLVRSPDFVASFTADYLIPLESGASIGLIGSLYYNDGFFFDSSNRLEQESYELIDASIQYTSADENYSVRLWGKNLTDTFYSHIQIALPVSVISQDAMPRNYGVTVEWNF
jgi:iron complex outermembrane recepter protein